MAFLSRHVEWILVVIVAAVFGFKLSGLLKRAKKIDKEGVVREAVISRVEEDWDPETQSTSYITYAQYRDEEGTLRESPMSIDPVVMYEAGDQVRIRFLPGEYDMVRIVKEDKSAGL